jgi:hypothetical protein
MYLHAMFADIGGYIFPMGVDFYWFKLTGEINSLD